MSQTRPPRNDISSNVIDQPGPGEKKRLGYYWPFLVSLLIIGLDQWSKQQAQNNLGPVGSGKQVELLGGQFRFIFIINKGASFGFLNKADVAWVFALLATGASLGIVIWYLWKGTRARWLQLGTGLVLGGIIGNLLDRLFQPDGGVRDILNFPNIELFKVFNVADSGITIGVVIIIATILFRGWREQQTAKEDPQLEEANHEPNAVD